MCSLHIGLDPMLTYETVCVRSGLCNVAQPCMDIDTLPQDPGEAKQLACQVVYLVAVNVGININKALELCLVVTSQVGYYCYITTLSHHTLLPPASKALRLCLVAVLPYTSPQ